MKESLLFVIFRDVFQFSSVAQSCPTLRPPGFQHARIPHPSPTPRVCSNSCPSSWWCHPTISSCHLLLLLSSVFPGVRVFSSESALCISRQSIGASASESALPMNSQDWFPSGLTDLTSFLSKQLSRDFSRTTVPKPQSFSAQPSSWSSSHIHTWLLENP